jgi:hypothetical protein
MLNLDDNTLGKKKKFFDRKMPYKLEKGKKEKKKKKKNN